MSQPCKRGIDSICGRSIGGQCAEHPGNSDRCNMYGPSGSACTKSNPELDLRKLRPCIYRIHLSYSGDLLTSLDVRLRLYGFNRGV